MNVTLSWDLFIIVFFSIIIAYSFIIGRNQTLKIIIGTYIATLTADGLANLIDQWLGGPNAALKLLAGPNAEEFLITLKIFVFISVIVVIAVRGGFIVSILADNRLVVRFMMTLLFGVLNAGLIVSTLLLYVSGLSLIGADQLTHVSRFASDSLLVSLMVQNYSVWFSLPAIAFVMVSLMERQEGQ